MRFLHRAASPSMQIESTERVHDGCSRTPFPAWRNVDPFEVPPDDCVPDVGEDQRNFRLR